VAWSSKNGSSGSPEVIDRGVMVACAITWLAVLGVAVAAGVALTNMGEAHSAAPTGDRDTPWLLYTVIGVSALVIVLAVPLLLRARRITEEPPPPPRTGPKTVQARAMMMATEPDPPDYPGPTPARYSSAVISAVALDRMWLRCGLGVMTGIGLAYVAVAVATYLMALNRVSASCAVYGVAGVITLATIAIPVAYLRRLRSALAVDAD